LSGHGGENTPKLASVSKVLDIEENVWSPSFGLKGKIDATVQVTFRGVEGRIRSAVIPFELKTGRSIQNLSHRAQTTMYNLLLSERYGT
jgi:DNA replication ATP-dependent helicase Dna2